MLLAAEALRDVPSVSTTVETPLGRADGRAVKGDVVVVPVLRAGLGMLDAVLELLPSARVGHIGLQRDEATAIASKYYSKLPSSLAEQLRADDRSDAGDGRQRVGGDRPAQERRRPGHPHDLHRGGTGRRRDCRRHHPDVHIYTPVVDEQLNAHKYIVPGLGDFGDRLYGTVC